MNRRQLISKINKRLKENGLSDGINTSKDIFNIVIDVLFEQISLGYSVKISEFGTFRSNLERKILNGKEIKRYVIKFKASKKIRDKINHGLQ